MYRSAMTFLDDWLISRNRKPLVIRGARQVGKTWIVRHLAATHEKRLVEINFEARPDLFSSAFDTNDPKEILLKLSLALGLGDINPETSLLFLDEIQTAPQILSKLRWFAEEMPLLPVVATGSLLEFLLAEYPFSMPVGRISYMHLEPLSFEEFLMAQSNRVAVDYLKDYKIGTEISQPIHDLWMKRFKEYIIVGGMPAAVEKWVSERSLDGLSTVQRDILATYRDDFNRYKGRLDVARLDEVLLSIPRQLGEKFVYKKVNASVQSTPIKHSLDLLSKARLCTKVKATAANGMPLGAEILENFIKVVLLDVGLCSTILDLSLASFANIHEITLVNSGGIAEQVVGQLLRTINPFYVEPSLYYWQRHEKGSHAEIDYLISHHGQIIPIEVKAGTAGRLKSLHSFMSLKKLKIAIRIYSGLPLLTDIKTVNSQGKFVKYTLLSLPFYMIGQIHRLLEEIKK